MREIKFRAFGKDEKEMYYIDNFYWFEEHGVEDSEGKGHYGDYILMQYTGMKDKHKDIYEGDVLRLAAHQDFFVDFHEGCFVCRSTNKVQRINWSPASLRLLIEDGYEVIGNIYENPDLVTQ